LDALPRRVADDAGATIVPSLRKCIEHADELAQEVVNAWGGNVSAGNAARLSPDFKALFEKTCRYRDAKQLADNHRQFNALSEKDAAEEIAARQEFAEAYRDFSDKYEPGGSKR
jgi:hypothetical protein